MAFGPALLSNHGQQTGNPVEPMNQFYHEAGISFKEAGGIAGGRARPATECMKNDLNRYLRTKRPGWVRNRS